MGKLGNVKCKECNRLVWMDRDGHACTACRDRARDPAEAPPAKRLRDLAAFRAWRDNADDDELLDAVAEYRAGDPKGREESALPFGALLASSKFVDFVIERIRASNVTGVVRDDESTRNAVGA